MKAGKTAHPKGGMGSGMRHAKNSARKHQRAKWQLGGQRNLTRCHGCGKNFAKLFAVDGHSLCEACFVVYGKALAEMGLRNPL